MTLRAKLSLFLSALLSLSIGVTGGVLIWESSLASRKEVRTGEQLFAENRAFALRDNLQILEGELTRLSLLPDIDPSDQNPEPEARLLESTHTHSILYNTAVLLLSADGTCTGAVGTAGGLVGRRFGSSPWFHEARRAVDGPFMRMTDEPVVGRTLNVVQPIFRSKVFAGALVGVVALDQHNLIVSALSERLPPRTDAMLIDERGNVIFPTMWSESKRSTEWTKVLDRARAGAPGTMTAFVDGEASLVAFAPVEAGSGFTVVFRRPWTDLVVHLQRQLAELLAVLLFGMVIAAASGIVLSAYLTRPLNLLRESAGRIVSREQRPAKQDLGRVSRDELGSLVEEFVRMEEAILQRDHELREAAALLERRVLERTRQLEQAQNALVAAERFAAMGKTSAAIAHELRNALNGLGMAVELILADPANRARVERLQTQVLSEIARLRDVVDSLNSFSGSPALQPRLENFTEIVARGVALAADLVADRGSSVSTDLQENVNVVCDGKKVQGVVLNLVRNGAEVARNVRVRLRSVGGDVLLEVADDGPGFSEEAKAHLFEPFFTTKRNGTGLGLPTSLRYVEAHGGSIRIETSAELGGASVEVRLPQGGPARAGASSTSDEQAAAVKETISS